MDGDANHGDRIPTVPDSTVTSFHSLSSSQQANLLRQFVTDIALGPTTQQEQSQPMPTQQRSSLLASYRRSRSNGGYVSIAMPDNSPTREASEGESSDREESAPVGGDTPPSETELLRTQYARLRAHLQDANSQTVSGVVRTQYARLRAYLQVANTEMFYQTVVIFVPFVALFLLQAIFSRIKSIFILVVLFGSLLALQQFLMICIERQTPVTNKMKKGINSILLVVTSYWAFGYLAMLDETKEILLFQWTSVQYMGAFDTIEAVITTDFFVKYITVFVKIIIAVLPEKVVMQKRKRRSFQAVEYFSQFFRAIVPAPRWINYFLGPMDKRTYLDLIIPTLYFSLKGTEICQFYTGGLFSAIRDIVRVSSYGSTPSADELANVPNCSICYETMCDPIKLKCTHMFCEVCVEQWLDQQQTCPMCRAKVDGDDKTWRNGATSQYIRIF